MRDEKDLRRHEFHPGVPIRLADGRMWIFPAPPPAPESGAEDANPGPRPPGPEGEYDALLVAILEAEDEIARLRAELALAIYLLGENYDLGPADYSRILEFPPDDPGLAAMQRDIRNLTADHIRQFLQRSQEAPGRRAWFGISPRPRVLSSDGPAFAR